MRALKVHTCKVFRSYLDGEIARLNDSVARVQTIKKYHILVDPFTEAAGELTPTLKIKRSVVCKNHGQVIESLYQGLFKLVHFEITLYCSPAGKNPANFFLQGCLLIITLTYSES